MASFKKVHLDEVLDKVVDQLKALGMDAKDDGFGYITVKGIRFALEAHGGSSIKPSVFEVEGKRFYQMKSGDYNYSGMVMAILEAYPRKLEAQKVQNALTDRQATLRTYAKKNDWNKEPGHPGFTVVEGTYVDAAHRGFVIHITSIATMEDVEKILKKLEK